MEGGEQGARSAGGSETVNKLSCGEVLCLSFVEEVLNPAGHLRLFLLYSDTSETHLYSSILLSLCVCSSVNKTQLYLSLNQIQYYPMLTF